MLPRIGVKRTLNPCEALYLCELERKQENIRY
jgi:hypothetical protein